MQGHRGGVLRRAQPNPKPDHHVGFVGSVPARIITGLVVGLRGVFDRSGGGSMVMRADESWGENYLPPVFCTLSTLGSADSSALPQQRMVTTLAIDSTSSGGVRSFSVCDRSRGGSMVVERSSYYCCGNKYLQYAILTPLRSGVETERKQHAYCPRVLE